MLVLEAVLVTVIATALGSAVAYAVLSAFNAGMTGTATPAIELRTYLGVTRMGGVLILVAALTSGRLALSAGSAARS